MTDEIISRLYWSTGEVAAQLGVKASAIRFWCRHFNLNPHKGRPTTNGGFVRRFNAGEVDKLTTIHRLLKIEGYTIPGARRQMEIQKAVPA